MTYFGQQDYDRTHVNLKKAKDTDTTHLTFEQYKAYKHTLSTPEHVPRKHHFYKMAKKMVRNLD